MATRFNSMPTVLSSVIKELIRVNKSDDLTDLNIIKESKVEETSHYGLKQKLIKLSGCAFGCDSQIFSSNLQSIKNDSAKYNARKKDADMSLHWTVNGAQYCLWKELTYKSCFENFINTFNNLYKNQYKITPFYEGGASDKPSYYEFEILSQDGIERNAISVELETINQKSCVLSQKIFFGAPGTGKSHKVNQIAPKNDLVTFRTTFHPDYDYAQFVGSYKPKKEGSSITYSFVPQVFAKAYVAAWREHLIAEKSEDAKSVYLVIEEINRGNCAQIFGDLFQLLDRKNGESEYPINADADFGQWLVDEAKVPNHEYDENGCVKIKLPPNFNILATMNTSDQSLFPMDSAFKRRFDWEYVPIQYKNPYNAEKEKEAHDKWLADKFVIDLGLKENNPKWLHFLKKVNADIYKVTQSEDKQMGEFFVKPKDGVIDLNMFRSKVLFYLWDSVYKDEVDQKTMFHFKHPEGNGSEVTFQSLFGEDAKAIEIIKKMMTNLDAAYESKDGSEFKDFEILQK